MASMRDIQRRKTSIQSTEQITKAMKLVATVKLQKARVRAEKAKPYFNHMYESVTSMLARSGNINHKYLRAGVSKKKAVIVITLTEALPEDITVMLQSYLLRMKIFQQTR